MYKFGKRSLGNLNTCHEDLQMVMKYAIGFSRIDFGISEGERTLERQIQMFDAGKSTIDGVNKKSKHQSSPSMACDIYAYHPNVEVRRKLAYDFGTLCYLGGLIVVTGDMLWTNKKIDHVIRFGGNWDRDGVILMDQNFDDLPHFELVNKAR